MSVLRAPWGRGRSPAPPPEPDTRPGRARLEESVAQHVRGLFGRDSLYMVIWALQVVGAAALTPLITRVMGSAQFGAVAAATAVMQVLFVIAGFGLRTAIQRQYVGAEGAVAARRLLTLTIIAATAVTLLVDSTGPVWSRYLGLDGYGGALRLAVYWAGASAVTNASLALLRSQDRLLSFSCVSLLQSVVAEAVSLLLVLAVRPTAAMFVLAQLLLQIVATALGLCLAPPKLLRPRDSALARAALAYSLPLVPGVLSAFALSAVDRLIVQAELGLAAVGRYQVAYNVGDMPTLLLGVLSTSWMPRIFALGASAERAAVLVAGRDALYRLLAPVVIGLSVGSPLVLRVWAPSTYQPDGLLLVTSLVIVSAIPYTAGLSATRVLLAEGRTATVAAATGVAAAVNVALNLVLVPRYQLVGAAVATFLAYSALHALLLRAASRVMPMPDKSPVRLVELAAAGVVALLATALPTTSSWLVVRGTVAATCLAWFGLILRRLNRGADRSRRAGRERQRR